MSLRKRYPLHTLLHLREHRTEKARQHLFERQRETQACRDQCAKIEGEIDHLLGERARQRARLMDQPPADVAWPIAFSQREQHIEHLAELAAAARGRLTKAQQALAAAEQAQEEARAAYFRARARQEALEKRKEIWHRDLRRQEERREEANTADLMQGRRSALIPS